ncbi:hypothetical protein N3K66_008928 [Trichothecium roseum]|uniref:Uncharacterized protein n=1 Tax=Trichothecium roseum TaxID=47278 RepID=A0ACC0URK5_9HYPO|nr:hypothetical protein N3K66_008928 [Trichothecium roseum]
MANKQEAGTQSTTGRNNNINPDDEIFRKHMHLLRSAVKSASINSADDAPIFTNVIQRHGMKAQAHKKNKKATSGKPVVSTIFNQFGLLAGDCEGIESEIGDPRLFYNVAAPSSAFICGSQGSGKSHTLSCLLENCLVASDTNVLPRPLSGIAFHYDSFTSDSAGSPCEAAYLSSHSGVKVRVLCAPTNTAHIKRIYKRLPNVRIEELQIKQTDLNTQRMLHLMGASIDNDSMPLYLHVVIRILRDLKMKLQQSNRGFDYAQFKLALQNEKFNQGQEVPLQQRLDVLESFIPQAQRLTSDPSKMKKAPQKPNLTKGQTAEGLKEGIDWLPKAGELTIVDLSCPCITAEMACSLFRICLDLFMEQKADIGRIVALDEAHKYMKGGTECQTLTEALLEAIRLQRHQGLRVFISTQEPTISTRLLDLCSITIVHRFSSPDWLQVLQKHLAGASSCSPVTGANVTNGDKSGPSGEAQGINPLALESGSPTAELLSRIVSLRTGEALLFGPNILLGKVRGESNGISGTNSKLVQEGFQRLGLKFLRVQIRQRITKDGGRSITAV